MAQTPPILKTNNNTMEKEKELREKAKIISNKWLVNKEDYLIEELVNFAKSEASKKYHQSEADRKIERLKGEVKYFVSLVDKRCKELDEVCIELHTVQSANLEWHNLCAVLQQKYDALKEKGNLLMQSAENLHNMPCTQTYEDIRKSLNLWRKEAKDGE